ncbi:hypothetical protein A9K55_002861 [Cordyceps militaris]|uniref:Uncharacterized protein n=1 Tax=Cordyceps militaris TaxID=73501 RepID=A0A2H4S6Y9_CORMI|nr:hypothetical protein A9K55_002861 [Cordyceps militaris]
MDLREQGGGYGIGSSVVSESSCNADKTKKKLTHLVTGQKSSSQTAIGEAVCIENLLPPLLPSSLLQTARRDRVPLPIPHRSCLGSFGRTKGRGNGHAKRFRHMAMAHLEQAGRASNLRRGQKREMPVSIHRYLVLLRAAVVRAVHGRGGTLSWSEIL